ncbi:MAG: hypothetical protein WC708_00300 [Lentisphaeria bacterium]|jgi:hypothetical protein
MIPNVISYTPVGVLQHVVKAFQIYNKDIGPDGLVSPRVEEWLKNFNSFFASPGIGCDAMIFRETPAIMQMPNGSVQRMIRTSEVRCREQPCAWFQYQLRGFSAKLGVRVCTDHVSIAGEEKNWIKTIIDKDPFAVWEIMTD